MIQVVGAGVGRTGTHSLKLALEQLLGGTCYHMFELFPRPAHVAIWHQAMLGQPVDWNALLGEFSAIVDWPGAAVWEEISRAFPEAKVLLSVRESPQKWWDSFSETILGVMERGPAAEDDPWFAMSRPMIDRFCPRYAEADQAMAAYVAHNDHVRSVVAPDRLIEWQPGDGWEPLCTGLGLPVPDEDFPHVNTTSEFRSNTGLA